MATNSKEDSSAYPEVPASTYHSRSPALPSSPPPSLAHVASSQSMTQPSLPSPDSDSDLQAIKWQPHTPSPPDTQKVPPLPLAGAAGVSEIDILAEVASSLHGLQDVEQEEASIVSEAKNMSPVGVSSQHGFEATLSSGNTTSRVSSVRAMENECTHPKPTCAVSSSDLQSLVDVSSTGEEASVDTVERLDGLLEIISSITGMQGMDPEPLNDTDTSTKPSSTLISNLIQEGASSDGAVNVVSGTEIKDFPLTPAEGATLDPGAVEVQRLMDAMMNTDIPQQTRKRKAMERKTNGRSRDSQMPNPDTTKIHKCPECDKYFPRKSSLNRHLLLHQEERPFQCSECKTNYKSYSQLKRHQRLHSGEKPAKCDHCLKTFRTYNELYTHRRTHTGEKPFECRHCGKCFSTRSYRNTHESIHTGDKRYECEFCSMKFTDMSARRTHRFTHTGELPYKCEACGKRFTQSGNLRKHARTVHDRVRPFRCEECGVGFGTKQELQRHVMRVHGTGTEEGQDFDLDESCSSDTLPQVQHCS